MSATQPIASPHMLQESAQQALAYAKAQGADAAEISLGITQEQNVSVRLEEVETLEFARDQGISIQVYFGQRQGSASCSDLALDSIKTSVEAACHIARYTEEDPDLGLADADLMATDFVDLQLDHPWDLSADQAIEYAKRCEAAGRQYAGISNSEGASCSTRRSQVLYANSHGFFDLESSSMHSLSCRLIAGSGSEMKRDYWYDLKRAATDLASPESIGQQTAERTLARLGAHARIPTGHYPVLFDPSMAASLLSSLVSAISGRHLYRESSFLLDHLGETLFPEFVHIDERPKLQGGLRSANADSEGVATRNNIFIHQGRLLSYALSSYSARRLNRMGKRDLQGQDFATTANAGGLHNLRVSTTGQSTQALVSSIQEGLWVTSLMGSGVNLVTGDYSRGAAGFWIQNGQIAYPVEGLTLAGNLKDMFQQVQAIGAETDPRSSIHTGAWLIEGMTVAGQTG